MKAYNRFGLMGFLLLLACAGSDKFTVWETTDPFYPGMTIYHSDWITIKSTGLTDPASVKMRPQCIVDENGARKYELSVIYLGENWAYINEAVFLIDGSRYAYDTSGDGERDVSHGSVMEVLNIELNGTLFEHLQNADNVSLRLRGDRRYFDKEFNAEMIWKMNFFYQTVLQKVNRKYIKGVN